MLKIKGIIITTIICLLLCQAGFAEGTQPAKSTGIISAMQNEIDLLLATAEIDHTDTVGGVDYHVGTLCGEPVVIAKAGIGKILSAAGVVAMLNNYDISRVLFTGIAGGVGDETRVLDVVIATELVQHDFGNLNNDGFVWCGGFNGESGHYSCDAELVEMAYRAALAVVGEGHVFRGLVASGDQFVASEAFVRRLQEEFNAIACEMEGASIALVCEQYNTPFVVIRTLSDKADGLAHETYENMADLAADNSCRIVMEMLKSSKAIEKND